MTSSTAMTMERAALCVNEKVRSPSTRHICPGAARLPSTGMLLMQVVAACGRNFFFPSKPDAFHQTCAKYARANTAVHVALLLAAGARPL